MASIAQDVSVVITCFDQGEALREAVDSVARQTMLPSTVIVVDDGSGDPATLRLLAELNGRTLRTGASGTSSGSGSPASTDIQVVRQRNAGVSAARNTGIRRARTAYVAVLDGDDRLKPSFIERTRRLLESKDSTVDSTVDSSVALTVAASGWMETFGVLKAVVRPEGGALPDFLARNRCPATCMMRRDAAMACGGYDESMRDGFEDWDFFISLLEAVGEGSRIAVDPEPLIEYRTDPASSNVRSMTQRLGLMRRLIDKHHDSYALYIAQAVLGVEQTSISRLELWERTVTEQPELLHDSASAATFMRSPAYGDGGMAAAVRIRSHSVGR